MEIYEEKNVNTNYDKIICSLTIWREARGQSQTARNGVFHVILNRVAASPRQGWPATVHGVCVQPYQFSSFNLGSIGSTTWPLEKNTSDWQAWEEIQQLIESPLLADPTNGATFYHDSSIAPPFHAWLGPNATLEDLLAKKTCDIGAFSFYAL